MLLKCYELLILYNNVNSGTAVVRWLSGGRWAVVYELSVGYQVFIGVGCGVVGRLLVGLCLVVSWLFVGRLLVRSWSVLSLSVVLQSSGVCWRVTW